MRSICGEHGVGICGDVLCMDETVYAACCDDLDVHFFFFFPFTSFVSAWKILVSLLFRSVSVCTCSLLILRALSLAPLGKRRPCYSSVHI